MTPEGAEEKGVVHGSGQAIQRRDAEGAEEAQRNGKRGTALAKAVAVLVVRGFEGAEETVRRDVAPKEEGAR